jgi:hypothetical protein
MFKVRAWITHDLLKSSPAVSLKSSPQVTVGRNQGFFTQASYEQLYQAAEKQSGMLSGLRKSWNPHDPQPSTLN